MNIFDRVATARSTGATSEAAQLLSQLEKSLSERDDEIERLREKLDYANSVIEQRNMEGDRLHTENEALRKDAERYKTLANYLVSTDTSRDDDIVACNTVAELSAVLDSMKGGE